MTARRPNVTPTEERWTPEADQADRHPPDAIRVRTTHGVETWTVEADQADRRPEPQVVVRSSGRSAHRARMARVLRDQPTEPEETNE